MMPAIPSLQQWKADTELSTPRSAEMKAIDKAIEVYNLSQTPENITRIRVALSKWTKSKGDNWESSARNKPPKRPISSLVDTVLTLRARLPSEEQQAVRFMIEQQQTLLERNFAKATLALPGFNAAVELQGVGAKLKGAGGAVKTASVAATKAAVSPEIMKGLNDLFGSEIQDIAALQAWVLKETGAQALAGVVSHVLDVLPVVSIVVGGAKALAQWGMVVKNLYAEYDVYSHRHAVAAGVPSAALEGLRDLLSRQTKFAAVKASIVTGGFVVNTGLHAAKGVGSLLTPAVAAAQATAQAVRAIALFAIQVREAVIIYRALPKQAASSGSNATKLDIDTIRRAPLLGCYVLIGASDSELIAMAWSEFGQPGWIEEVNSVLKDFKPLMDSAASLIQTSPFKLENVPNRRSMQLSAFGKAKYLATWLL